jgi:hypothetical protein
MDLNVVAAGVGVAIVLPWVRLPPSLRVTLPVLLLLGSVFSFGLTGVGHVFALIGSAFQGAGLAFLLVEVVKGRLRFNTSARWLRGHARLVVFGGGLLVALAAFRILTADDSGDVPSAVNPWGLAFLAVTVLYWMDGSEEVQRWMGLKKAFPVLTAFASLVLLALMLLVTAGVVAGNTEKVALGAGGVGLANTSTNETGALAACLLLFNLRLLIGNRGPLVGLGMVALVGSLVVIVLTRSRIAIGVAFLMVLMAALGWASGNARRRLIVLLPVLLMFIAAGVAIIKARSAAEAVQFSTSGQLGAVAFPGGERALLWVSYGSAFLNAVSRDPWLLWYGVGPVGVYRLYGASPLPALGITAEGMSFYPVHSDVLQTFFTLGVLGVACWGGILLGLVRTHLRPDRRVQGYAALLAFCGFSTVDMLQYAPVLPSLLLLAFADAVGRAPAVSGNRP